MDAREIQLFSCLEKEHFFYRGRREVVRRWLAWLFPEQKPLVVDAGAGTGIFIEEIQAQAEVFGCDVFFDPGISLSGSRLAKADVCRLPFAENFADAVVALDLLEHLDDDFAAVRELARCARPGGYLFINVPAFPALMSDWDKAVGHRRRYSRRMIREFAEKEGLEIIFLRYLNSLPFLPILAYRWLRSNFGIGKTSRLEDRLPPKWINSILRAALVAQGTTGWIKIPFGVSLFAVMRKKSGNN